MTGRNNKAIIFFVKEPVPGKVKTRLAKSIGENNACELYKCFIMDLAVKYKSIDSADTFIFYSPEKAEAKLANIIGKGNYYAQTGNNLGTKMHNAFIKVFSFGYDSIIITGSDCIDINKKTIESAFSGLSSHDCVIGPANDGGYYLMGFNKNNFIDSVFYGIKWSTNLVFAGTVKILNEHGLFYKELDTKIDIDVLEDLTDYINQTGNSYLDNLCTVNWINENLFKKIDHNK